ncbi:MAG TPA: right-handed parallel beta-helix repeat-containing protein [Candidatus Baltobacteraceae bacterium]|nr:right-handed parallel beta-helix repeat-containing protein [Candidatus Baltobacteraceae bacterium]
MAALAAAPQLTIVTMPTNVTLPEIQHALDSLPATGGEVILPAGKIELSEPIVLSHENQSLRGAGDATILFVADNANCPAIIMGEPVNNPRHVKNLHVSDVFIDGNRAHQQRERWKLSGQEGSQICNNGITVQNVTDSTIENVTTAHTRSGGIVTTANTQRLTVRGLNSFDNYFDGIACFQTENCTFSNLNLHDNCGAGISLDGNFHHNVFDNAVLAGNDLGIFMRWSHDNEFRNISIRDSRHYGVFMAQNIDAAFRDKAQPDCVNNSFTQLTAGQCGKAAFRVNDVTCTNNYVSGAKFSGDVHAQLSLAMPGLLLVK